MFEANVMLFYVWNDFTFQFVQILCYSYSKIKKKSPSKIKKQRHNLLADQVDPQVTRGSSMSPTDQIFLLRINQNQCADQPQ